MENDDEFYNRCLNGWGLTVNIRKTHDDNYVITNSNGFYATHCQANKVIAILQRYVNENEDEQIKKCNDKIMDDKNQYSKDQERKYEKEKYKKKCGYVYLLTSDKATKIGISKQPVKRTKYLTEKMPFECKTILVKYVYDYYKVEKDLHKKYKEKKINGEWFNLSVKDIEIIKKILEKKSEKINELEKRNII